MNPRDQWYRPEIIAEVQGFIREFGSLAVSYENIRVLFDRLNALDSPPFRQKVLSPHLRKLLSMEILREQKEMSKSAASDQTDHTTVNKTSSSMPYWRRIDWSTPAVKSEVNDFIDAFGSRSTARENIPRLFDRLKRLNLLPDPGTELDSRIRERLSVAVRAELKQRGKFLPWSRDGKTEAHEGQDPSRALERLPKRKAPLTATFDSEEPQKARVVDPAQDVDDGLVADLAFFLS